MRGSDRLKMSNKSDHEKVSVMTDMSTSYILQLEEEAQRLHEENHQLKQALESEQLTEKAFNPFQSIARTAILRRKHVFRIVCYISR